MEASKSNAARFTAGPWVAKQYGQYGEWQVETGDRQREIAPKVLGLRGQDEANAHLIAAAPALYEATVEDDALAVAIEATLRSVAVPSGCPEVSRAFADIRGMLQATTAKRRSALAQARGEATT
jgi:hypothetical protein